jgi:hypothetical protein
VSDEPREDIRAYARRYGHIAVDFLARTIEGEDVPYSARVVAAKEILDRGYGKPPQSTEGLG